MLEIPKSLKPKSGEVSAFGVIKTVHSQTPPIQMRLTSSERLRLNRRIIIGILKNGIKNAAMVPIRSIIIPHDCRGNS